jgi:transcription initiation factor IIF auxiliary subunit
MKLALHNSWKYEGEDWWSWSAYLKGDDLEKIDYVEYILHPTFERPVRKIKDRATFFRIYAEGWGSFELKAIVYRLSGQKCLLTHTVKLAYEPRKGNTESAAQY